MTEGGATTTYSYDKNNRLLEQVVGGTQKKFNYDDRGNLYSKTISVLTATDADAKANTLKYSDDSTSLLFEYDGFNRLNKASSGRMTAEYQYNAEGIRTSKTVNGDKIDFVLDGVNVIAEIRPDGDVTNYVRGLTGIIYRKTKDGTKTYYVKNNHGDVTKLVNSSGVVIKSYNYNEFGVESNADKTDTNPFRYCGEYYDNETGLIYLRARYYDMTIGRFISEDPIRDGFNWYSYCNGNPISFADPLGLFDYNTRLSYSQDYNDDVVALQNELAYLGYLDMSNGGWGYYGEKTQAAVNVYKISKGLGNAGKDKGVVGLQTWQSLGLYYRTQKDIDAGVAIVTIGKKQYYDISIPVNNAVYNSKEDFANHKDLPWFINQVHNAGKWNIKRDAEVWSSTLGISKNSYNNDLIFYGRIVNIDDVGNITYGYLGSALGIPEETLLYGSLAYHLYNHGTSDMENEIDDEFSVHIGVNWYKGLDITVPRS